MPKFKQIDEATDILTGAPITSLIKGFKGKKGLERLKGAIDEAANSPYGVAAEARLGSKHLWPAQAMEIAAVSIGTPPGVGIQYSRDLQAFGKLVGESGVIPSNLALERAKKVTKAIKDEIDMIKNYFGKKASLSGRAGIGAGAGILLDSFDDEPHLMRNVVLGALAGTLLIPPTSNEFIRRAQIKQAILGYLRH